MKLTKEDKILIKEAGKIVTKSLKIKLAHTGDIGSALITHKGNIFSGVCTGFYCGIGSCAEHQATGSMISNGEKDIKTIVTVHYTAKNKSYKIIPPCGKCREMIHQLGKKSQNSEIIISSSKKVKLKDLLPHPWSGTIDK